jgi:hypothetical protein
LVEDDIADLAVCPRGQLIWYDPDDHDLPTFIESDRLFRIALTPSGMAWVDSERRRRAESAAIDIGDEIGNRVVRRILEDVVKGREVPPDRREIIERITAKLVWIGVHSYRDKEFLVGRALQAVKGRGPRSQRRDLERRFYQPFVHSELARDPALGRHLTKGPEQTGGSCDLLAVGDFPIEIKVLYPDYTGPVADLTGIGQTTQYAARSGIGFLAVLDMRPRTTASEAGQIENDVKVVEVKKQDGDATVRIVQVRHVVGHGRPSKVRK